ncbi:MAG: MmgE/PrpD family protein [SAR202 cluster bacterium]|nr:MmgE/PrpD family protein [SAR202 cluster bacterium]
MPNDYLDHLSQFAASLSWDRLPGSARSAAKDVALDTIGAILAGCRLPENAALARFASSQGGGPAIILGHGYKAQPMFAALANATAGVAMEVDEGTRLGGGHPAIHTLPGALAVAEEKGLGGKKLLEALVAGYEVSSRIGGATVAKPIVHSHGTWGTIGTAVAVARLLDFDAPKMRQVINLAASMTPANTWTPCYEGATIRNVYPGRSGMQGILAVHLQQCGFTGLRDGPSDVYGRLLADSFDPQAAVVGLGKPPYRIEQNYFKFHACCLFNHPTLDAIAALLQDRPFTPADVKSIKVTTVPPASQMGGPYPPNRLSAKFNIPYAVASLIVNHRSDIPAFEPAAIDNPQIKQLAAKISLSTDAKMSLRDPKGPVAAVSIALNNGHTLDRDAAVHHGDFQSPRPRQSLVDKFLNFARPTCGQDGSNYALMALEKLEDLPNVRQLTLYLG